MTVLRVYAAQLNQCVGDIEGNATRILNAIDRANDADADVLVMPELSLPGYPPEDLLLRVDFIEEQMAALGQIVSHSGSCTVLVGFAEPVESIAISDTSPRRLHNSVAIMRDGQIIGIERKKLLPDYGVFDETRWFRPGVGDAPYYEINGVKATVIICEDLWDPSIANERAAAGAQVILSPNASPWRMGKFGERLSVAQAVHLPVVYVNQVGAQDEVIYDGDSFAMVDNEVIWQSLQFEEFSDIVELHVADDAEPWRQLHIARSRWQNEIEGEVWGALSFGLRDYARKNGFERCWIGLSGGIDSAVVAALAVDALGPGKVTGVLMPSAYSSDGSVSDAELLAKNLNIETYLLPITSPVDAVMNVMHGRDGVECGPFAGTQPNVAEENIQARVRGLYLMALSNKFGGLVLTTGNKSEVAVGYSTLYGDMAGGLAPISDVPKTLVYRLAKWRNRLGELIPEATITKPPSAELAPDQKDADSLPPYDVLDAILALYVDADMNPSLIVENLVDQHMMALTEAVSTVERVVGLVDRAEYKRRQAPPGLKISGKAFGRDRRLPITNGYRKSR